MKFEIYKERLERAEWKGSGYTMKDQWRWRLKARNGKIIADSGEAYATEQGIRRAITKLNRNFVTIWQVPVVKVNS